MLARFTPTWMIDATFDIAPKELKQLGIRVVLTDLDNTLIAWNNPYGTEELREWMTALARENIRLVVVSNNSHQRIKKAVASLQLPYISRALKPLSLGIRRALKQYQVEASEAVMVGDQLLTDVAAANGSGVKSILVRPILPSDAWTTKFNRFAEKFVMRAIRHQHPELNFRKDLMNERD